jgi:hypothetical protein
MLKHVAFIFPLLLIACNSEPKTGLNPIEIDPIAETVIDSSESVLNPICPDTLQIGECTFYIRQSPDTILFQGVAIFERENEAKLLSNDKQVERIGDSLRFQLANGKELFFADNPFSEKAELEAKLYNFQGSIAASNYWENLCNWI